MVRPVLKNEENQQIVVDLKNAYYLHVPTNCVYIFKKNNKQSAVAHTCNPSAWVVGAGAGRLGVQGLDV